MKDQTKPRLCNIIQTKPTVASAVQYVKGVNEKEIAIWFSHITNKEAALPFLMDKSWLVSRPEGHFLIVSDEDFIKQYEFIGTGCY